MTLPPMARPGIVMGTGTQSAINSLYYIASVPLLFEYSGVLEYSAVLTSAGAEGVEDYFDSAYWLC